MAVWRHAILTGVLLIAGAGASHGQPGPGISRVGIGPGPNGAQAAGWGAPAQPGEAAYRRAVHIARYDGAAASVGALEHAVALGSPSAMTRLGLMYVRGEGVARDETHGIALVREAALMDDPAGMLALASAFHHGEGVAKDEAQARYWLVRAAETGYRPAMEARRRLAAP